MNSSGLPVSLLLILSVAIVSFVTFSSSQLMNRLILIPRKVVRQGQFHRLLTAGWIHGDLGHLFFNMLSLYFFAGFVEAALGSLQFLLLYISAVVFGFVPTTIRHRDSSKYRSLGASGAVAAVIFSAILIKPDISMYLMFIPIPIPGWLFAIVYLAYSAYSSRHGRDNINHDAHFAGAVYGVAFTFALAPELAVAGLQRLL